MLLKLSPEANLYCEIIGEALRNVNDTSFCKRGEIYMGTFTIKCLPIQLMRIPLQDDYFAPSQRQNFLEFEPFHFVLFLPLWHP